MKKKSLALLGLAGVALFAGCSGGGGGGMAPGPVMHPATAGPTSAPQAGAPLQTAQLDGSAAYVTASNMPVYEFSGDMTDMSNCTGGCLSVWPRSTCAGRDPPGRMDVVHAARHAHRAAGVQRLTAVHV